MLKYLLLILFTLVGCSTSVQSTKITQEDRNTAILLDPPKLEWVPGSYTRIGGRQAWHFGHYVIRHCYMQNGVHHCFFDET